MNASRSFLLLRLARILEVNLENGANSKDKKLTPATRTQLEDSNNFCLHKLRSTSFANLDTIHVMGKCLMNVNPLYFLKSRRVLRTTEYYVLFFIELSRNNQIIIMFSLSYHIIIIYH